MSMSYIPVPIHLQLHLHLYLHLLGHLLLDPRYHAVRNPVYMEKPGIDASADSLSCSLK